MIIWLFFVLCGIPFTKNLLLGLLFSIFIWRRFLSNLLLLLLPSCFYANFVEQQETCWKSVYYWVRPAGSVFHYCPVLSHQTINKLKWKWNLSLATRISTHVIVKWLLIGSHYQIVSANHWSLINNICRIIWCGAAILLALMGEECSNVLAILSFALWG